jgi:hypothetical protein
MDSGDGTCLVREGIVDIVRGRPDRRPKRFTHGQSKARAAPTFAPSAALQAAPMVLPHRMYCGRGVMVAPRVIANRMREQTRQDPRHGTPSSWRSDTTVLRQAAHSSSRLPALRLLRMRSMPLPGPGWGAFLLQVPWRDFVVFHRHSQDGSGHLTHLNHHPWAIVG